MSLAESIRSGSEGKPNKRRKLTHAEQKVPAYIYDALVCNNDLFFGASGTAGEGNSLAGIWSRSV